MALWSSTEQGVLEERMRTYFKWKAWEGWFDWLNTNCWSSSLPVVLAECARNRLESQREQLHVVASRLRWRHRLHVEKDNSLERHLRHLPITTQRSGGRGQTKHNHALLLLKLRRDLNMVTTWLDSVLINDDAPFGIIGSDKSKALTDIASSPHKPNRIDAKTSQI